MNILFVVYKTTMHSRLFITNVFIASFYLASTNPLTDLFGAINSETPPFDIVSKGAKYEVRRYKPQLWAQVDYTVDPSTDFDDKASIGFQPLFQYITGKNERQEKIPMTAPVVMQQINPSAGQRRMAFIMPASIYSKLELLPKPTDVKVKLVSVDQPLTLACIIFNMTPTSKRIAAREAELRGATNTDSIQLVGETESVRIGGYNPPWTLPWLRTNELCIPLVNQA